MISFSSALKGIGDEDTWLKALSVRVWQGAQGGTVDVAWEELLYMIGVQEELINKLLNLRMTHTPTPDAKGALQIVVLDQGRIIESGTHSQLLARNGRYKTMWQRQATVDDTAQPLST